MSKVFEGKDFEGDDFSVHHLDNGNLVISGPIQGTMIVITADVVHELIGWLTSKEEAH